MSYSGFHHLDWPNYTIYLFSWGGDVHNVFL